MVFYLKYRPQKFEDLDSLSVRETLKAVLSEVKVRKRELSFHAFLFTGPKGLGKTSTARIVAKFLNCERRKPGDLPAGRQGLEPCNRCYQCTSVTAGNNLDIVEIDAASNRGIDEIRELKERINLATVSASYKVYIIDEVHMLTTEAFNALLKTLEEPPKHVVFILCTTEPQKVPATIISRCLHVSFKIAGEEELVRSFKRIVSGEKLNVDKEALSLIAKFSDGSFRDGSKILQELSVKAKGRKITQEFVQENFKTVSVSFQTQELIKLLEEKDTKKALELVQKSVDEGVEMKYFVEELISGLHLILLAKIDEAGDSKLTLEEVKRLLHLLMNASSQIKYAVLPQLPLELAIVEFCSENSDITQKSGEPEDQSIRKSESPIVRQAGVPSSPSFLDELITQVNTQNKTIAGLLRGVHLKETNGKKVKFETKFKFHKEKLEERNAKDLIEKMASEILKKNVTIEVSLGGDLK